MKVTTKKWWFFSTKIPSLMKIDFLMAIRESQTVKNSKSISEKLIIVQNTLLKMARIQDHIEGGLFRYSVDANGDYPILKKCFTTMPF